VIEGMADRFSLDGKVALVTGGTRGIGRAIAETLAGAGASVFVTARKPAEIEETVTALAAAGARVDGHAGSAGDPEAVTAGVARCMEQFGRLDVLVNNAATNPQYGPLAEADMGAVQKVLSVNLEGPLRYIQEAWKWWMKENGGTVVNIASMGGLRVEPMLGAYNVSKAALLHMTAQLAREMAPGVRVNAVAPGLIKTDMSRALWEQQAIVDRQPLGFVAEPADVATAVLFLASSGSRYVTGETIFVDGGVSTT